MFRSIFPSQKAKSSIIGHGMLIITVTKLASVFSGKEGTFLRRNLFLAFGASQSLLALSLLLGYESDAKRAGTSFLPSALLFGIDGAILLWDATQRDRPVKPAAKGK